MVLLKLILVLSVNLVLPSPPSPHLYQTLLQSTPPLGPLLIPTALLLLTLVLLVNPVRSFTTLTTFEPPVVCRRDDISCGPATSATNSDTAAQHLTSGMTVTETEFAFTWVVTKSDGSVFTESGIVGQSGTSFTTLTTFAPTTSSGAVQTEYTSTWEVTNTDGSVSTKSGIIDQSGTYFTTLSTFAQLHFWCY